MSPIREPLPGPDEWAARLDLHRRAGEHVGPCPVCGGTDRLHVRPGRGGVALVGCRGCIDGQPDAARAEAFGALLRAAFPERFEAATGRGPESPCAPFSGSGPCARPSRTPRTAQSGAEPFSGADSPRPDPRRELARRLWEAAAPADDSPGRAYLAARMAWPPAGIGPDLPPAVRWLPASADPDRDPTAKWYGLPASCAGALAFAWRRPGDDAAVVAVSLEALDVDGRRPDQAGTGARWRLRERAGAPRCAWPGSGERRAPAGRTAPRPRTCTRPAARGRGCWPARIRGPSPSSNRALDRGPDK